MRRVERIKIIIEKLSTFGNYVLIWSWSCAWSTFRTSKEWVCWIKVYYDDTASDLNIGKTMTAAGGFRIATGTLWAKRLLFLMLLLAVLSLAWLTDSGIKDIYSFALDHDHVRLLPPFNHRFSFRLSLVRNIHTYYVMKYRWGFVTWSVFIVFWDWLAQPKSRRVKTQYW